MLFFAIQKGKKARAEANEMTKRGPGYLFSLMHFPPNVPMPVVSPLPGVPPRLAQAQAFLGTDGVTGQGASLTPREPGSSGVVRTLLCGP